MPGRQHDQKELKFVHDKHGAESEQRARDQSNGPKPDFAKNSSASQNCKLTKVKMKPIAVGQTKARGRKSRKVKQIGS